MMQRFQHVVCVSQVIKDSIIEVIGDPGNLVVCYNPAESVGYSEQGSRTGGRYSPKPETSVIRYSGQTQSTEGI